MVSYVEGALIQGETIVHLGRVSLWSLFKPIIAGLFAIALGIALLTQKQEIGPIAALMAFAAGLVFLVGAYVTYKTTELAITSKRIIAKSGFVRRHTIEINLAKVESLRVE